MHTRSGRVTGAVLTAALVALLCGCLPTGGLIRHSDPAPSATETAGPGLEATPWAFTSRAEALHAAAEAYKRYLVVLDAILADGGERPERIRPFVSARFDLSLDIVFDSMRDSGLHTTGHARVAGVELADYREDESGRVVVQLRTCQDLSGTRALNAAGDDVTPSERLDRTFYDITLSTQGSAAGKLLISGTKARPEDGPC